MDWDEIEWNETEQAAATAGYETMNDLPNKQTNEQPFFPGPKFSRPPIYLIFAIAYHVTNSYDGAELYLQSSHFNSPMGRQVRDWMKHHGLITQTGQSTPKLEAWIKYLCSVPLPVETWTVPTNLEIL